MYMLAIQIFLGISRNMTTQVIVSRTRYGDTADGDNARAVGVAWRKWRKVEEEEIET